MEFNLQNRNYQIEITYNQLISILEKMDSKERISIFQHFAEDFLKVNYELTKTKNTELESIQLTESENRLQLIETGKMKVVSWNEVKKDYGITV